MVEVAITIAAKVVEFLVGPVVSPFNYVWNYRTNFQNLESQVQKLNGRRDTVQHSVNKATRNVEEIEQHVIDWLDRVKTITDESSAFIEENEQVNTKCFKGLTCYQRSRKAVKKAEVVARLYDEGKFDRISYRTILKETWIPSYKGYISFESRLSILKNILEALNDPDVDIVGVYGMGGIGKTMLVKEFAMHVEDEKLFDVVAFAQVSVKPDMKEIQQEIADKLGLTFREEGILGRARTLRKRLKQEKKVLLVLDNIWERLDLEKVGIPFGSDHMGCKLLLTARSREVLSDEMDSQNNFSVGFLNDEEAWHMFRNIAGACTEEGSYFQPSAIDVAKTCGGVPIAIVTIAKALRNKDACEWRNALQELQNPSLRTLEGVAREAYACVESSYILLKDEELRSTFLLCSMMTSIDITLVEYLVIYGKGMGIFKSIDTIKEARDRTNTLVRKLKDASLLLDTSNYRRFSMHDVVRDVGRSIASRDQHTTTVLHDDVRRDWDNYDDDTWKSSTTIFFRKIVKLPEKLECPCLQFLYMKAANSALAIPDNFFIGIPELRVLHLEGFSSLYLPTSLGRLVNLRTLYINGCKVQDITVVAELKNLEILHLDEFNYEELPGKICQLRLRFLKLYSCKMLKVIPPNVISRLTRLEELYLDCESIQWEVQGRRRASVDELKHLPHLTALEIYIQDSNVLRKGLFARRLEKYNIGIGHVEPFNWFLYDSIRPEKSRKLRLNLGSSCSCFEDGISRPCVKNVLSALDGRGFPELEQLWVHDSPCFLSVVDCSESESCDPFPYLETLMLENLINLDNIYNGQLGAYWFCQLSSISINGCENLKNIFRFSTARALPVLEDINVYNGQNMTQIFAIGREENNIQLKKLRFLTLEHLPQLQSFFSISNNEVILEDESDAPIPFFNQMVGFPSLEELQIIGAHELRMIWHKQLADQESFCIPKSKTKTV